jgi:hypothetical protein
MCVLENQVRHTIISLLPLFPVLEPFTSDVCKRFPYLNSLVPNWGRNEHRHCDKDKHTHTHLVINKGLKIGKFIDFLSFCFITLHPTRKAIFTHFS